MGFFGSVLKTLEISGSQPDVTRAYRHYRSASGADLIVNYEKAIREDALTQSAFDNEISSVLSAVKEIHDGMELTFEFLFA